MGDLVEAARLYKRYEGSVALDRISFAIPEGRIVGLLGPNGAGKTTLIKILAGLTGDYRGQVLIDGRRPGPQTKALVSYLPDRFWLSGWMKVGDALEVYADFFADFDREKANELLRRLGIEPHSKVTRLSRGTREKVQLVLAMSRRARLYLLDEPLGGVDPASRDLILDTIIRNYSENSSVLLSTQLIHDVERVFDRILMLDQGKILIDDEVDRVRAQHGRSVDELFREVFKCF